MERANIIANMHTAFDTAYGIIRAFQTATQKVGEAWSNLQHKKEVERALRDQAHQSWDGLRKLLTSLAIVTTLAPKISAQNAGERVQIGGKTYTVTKSVSLDQLQKANKANTAQYSQTSASGYGHTQSPLGTAQNTIISKGLVVDAQLTEGLNRDVYAYACFDVNNRDNICLIQKSGKVEYKSRSRCFSDKTGVCNAYCGPQRHISLEEAYQLADVGIFVQNHTNETRQVYSSVMVEGAIMDGEVPTPMEEVVQWNSRGYYLDNELSAGINPESGVYTVLTNRMNGQSVVISREPHYDEQTGLVTCAKLEKTAKLRSDKAGNASPYNGRNGNDQLRSIRPARGQPAPLKMGRVLQQGGPSKAEKRVNTFQGNRQINGRGGRSW